MTQGLKIDQGTGRTHGGRLLGGHVGRKKPAPADSIDRR
ncbi:hypothetical protein PCL1606_01640 [Pseudomonas chlororaphis]|uniref:Uncharacterized protein n=1 Tax=Pseudomonas chlororaphis TaxID=587753 RepID=A0A0D5XRF5_9PSED|nr:hypothetical protein PCL1606_01640 [Pseudomonas chlororaphis]